MTEETKKTPQEEVLEHVAKTELDTIVVLGVTKDGQLYFQSSSPNRMLINWIIDKSKLLLMHEQPPKEEPVAEEPATEEAE